MTSINAVPVVFNSSYYLKVLFYQVILFKVLSCILSCIYLCFMNILTFFLKYLNFVLLLCFIVSSFSLWVFFLILYVSIDTQIKVFLHSNICRISVHHKEKPMRCDYNSQTFTVIITNWFRSFINKGQAPGKLTGREHDFAHLVSPSIVESFSTKKFRSNGFVTCENQLPSWWKC